MEGNDAAAASPERVDEATIEQPSAGASVMASPVLDGAAPGHAGSTPAGRLLSRADSSETPGTHRSVSTDSICVLSLRHGDFFSRAMLKI